MARYFFRVLFFLVIFSAYTTSGTKVHFNSVLSTLAASLSVETPEAEKIKNLFLNKTDFIARRYNFPVGIPNGYGYYNAQKFGENFHLGEDWNSNTGGNSDLGDPIYAIANGYIREVKDHGGGWGWVVRMLHMNHDGTMIESLYAHCDTVLVKEGDWIKIGAKIATIGNAHGSYMAHLHFEIREDIHMPLGRGYGKNTKGFVIPTSYIQQNRKK